MTILAISKNATNNMSDSTNDFKLLAIRPLEDCSRNYCNNLNPGTLYKFYQYYDFKEVDGVVTKIEQKGSDHDIYDDFVPDGWDLKINVSAIVGKNGSGKSTLVELFYRCAYLVAFENNLLPANGEKISAKRETAELARMQTELKLEVYYFFMGAYRCILLDSKGARELPATSNIKVYDLFAGKKPPLSDFFYTIAVNYSIYGLNESIMGAWLGRLFHKNDGYRTPLVLNPFRDKGTINVNGEMHFAQTRLLSNIRFNNGEANEIVPGKRIGNIVFIISKSKFNRVEGHSKTRIYEELQKVIPADRIKIFEEIYTAILGEAPDFSSLDNKEWQEMTIDYVIFKVIRIAKNYSDYRIYYTENSEEQVPGIKNLAGYLIDLRKDFTHITLKLRQALSFFQNDPLRLGDKRIGYSAGRITIQASLLEERLADIRSKYPDRDPMEFVPIAPFTLRVFLQDGQAFDRLSSGEQQLVHSIQAVLYHILNLDSVFKHEDKLDKIIYNSINIIFDEIELYFHPEYQRRFVSEILQQISHLKAPNISAISILFLTHSPFILSDIPAVNVLRLEDGNAMEGQLPTFAANIHQMLSSSFFMKSTTGDFAKLQFDHIITFYRKVQGYFQQDRKTLDGGINSRNLQPDAALRALKEEYVRRRPRFSFIKGQIGEQVIRGMLDNHLSYLDEKLLEEVDRPDELSALKKRLEKQLDDVNKKLNKRR
jgi:hypothetical protein